MGSVAGAVFLVLLALAYVLFNSHGKSDGGRSTVHVTSNEVEMVSQEERGRDNKEENLEEEEGQESENNKDEERKKVVVRAPRPAAQNPRANPEVAALPNAATQNSVAINIGQAVAGSDSRTLVSTLASSQGASLNGVGIGSRGFRGASRMYPQGNMQGITMGPTFENQKQLYAQGSLGNQQQLYAQGTLGNQQQLYAPGSLGNQQLTPSFVVPFLSKAPTLKQVSKNHLVAPSPRSALFQSCQQQVNLWQYMSVAARDVVRGELLGRGAYAEVYKGRVLNAALNTDCAIKVYRSTASPKQLEEARREISLGASLDHPCTLRILGWIRQPLQTISELCCGDLKAFYSNKIEQIQYSEMEALRLLRVRHIVAIFA